MVSDQVAGRKYKNMDLKRFSPIREKQVAYWLGFIAADGCVMSYRTCNSDCLAIELQERDIAHLNKFKKAFNLNKGFYKRTLKGKNYYKITEDQPGLVLVFSKYGVVPNKTTKLKFPHKLNSNLIPAYLRGLFDGDGCIFLRDYKTGKKVNAKTKKSHIMLDTMVITAGSRQFLDEICLYLQTKGIKSYVKQFKPYKSTWSLVYRLFISTSNFDVFYKLLYTKCGMDFLSRKKKIFDLFCSKKNIKLINN